MWRVLHPDGDTSIVHYREADSRAALADPRIVARHGVGKLQFRASEDDPWEDVVE